MQFDDCGLATVISLFSLRVAINGMRCYRQPWQLKKLIILCVYTHRISPFISWWMAVRFPNYTEPSVNEWLQIQINENKCDYARFCLVTTRLPLVGQRPLHTTDLTVRYSYSVWDLAVEFSGLKYRGPFWMNESKPNSNEIPISEILFWWRQ